MDRQTRDVLNWIGVWTAVFAANLIVPFPLAMLAAGVGRVRIGILCGVWLLWAAGAVLGAVWVRFRAILNPAAFIALTQVVPMVQIVAGTAGLYVGDQLTDAIAVGDEWETAAKTFTATLVTGQLLIGLALFMAFFDVNLTGGSRPPGPPPSSAPPASPC